MIIGWIGAIGLMYCILILPQTTYGQQKMKERFSNDLMYMYVTFLMMMLCGFMLGI